MKNNAVIADLFLAVDLDRTLLDTNQFSQLLIDCFGLTPEEKEVVDRHVARQQGESFDLYTYLVTRFGDRLDSDTSLAAQLRIRMRDSEPQSRILMPGAQHFCQVLTANAIPWGIITKGETQLQSIKLDLFREMVGDKEVPALIITHPNKSGLITQEWWDATAEYFVLPSQLGKHYGIDGARTIWNPDDKQSNLTHTAQGYRGILIGFGSDRREEALDLEDLVREVQSIDSRDAGSYT